MFIFGATDTPVLDFLSFGFKARVGSLVPTLRRHTWYTFPEIHLWCDTSAGVYNQHSSQSLSPHACFSRGRMLDLNHRPPAWQADALTTRPLQPGLLKPLNNVMYRTKLTTYHDYLHQHGAKCHVFGKYRRLGLTHQKHQLLLYQS